MGKKQGKVPRTRREILNYGRKLGGEIVEGGRHTKIYNTDTGEHVSVPRHNTLNRYTAGGIVARLGAIFLASLVLLIPGGLIAWLVRGLSDMYGG